MSYQDEAPPDLIIAHLNGMKVRIAQLEAALKDARYLLGYTVTLDGPDDVDTFFDQVTDRIDELLPENDSTQRATLETKGDG